MNPLTLKYLFRASFEDGSIFHQNQEDVDSKDSHKSSFTEFLRICKTKKCVIFQLVSQDKDKLDWPDYFVNLKNGSIFFNKEPIYKPEWQKPPLLLDDCNLRVVYFRTVQQHRIVPALFHNPKKLQQLETGELQVTDKDGNDHVFPETARVFKEIHGSDNQFFVYPTEDSAEIVSYTLGWQTTVEENRKLKNLEHTIEIK